MKINKTQFKKWIAALDSGEFKQSKNELENKNGYCCLGVACKILIPKNKQQLDFDGFLTGMMPRTQPNAPEWLAGIDDDFHSKADEYLTMLNDDKNFTFPEIATMLELVYIHKAL